MIHNRRFHKSSVLTNGKVLVTGGENSVGSLNSAELYNPSTGTWTLIDNMNNSRYHHTSSLLTNGKILIAGGQQISALKSAELYQS
ncbi:unnamed protein product [Adineta ricciae]|nr:unnamed protein product [Adineta ricciae]